MHMRVAVIGAGPSGLVTLKYLLTAHRHLGTESVEAKIFESEPGIGGTFAARTYEDAELVSSSQLTTFSDFRPQRSDADFFSARRYVEYLEDYCTEFKLWPNIHLSTTVVSISRTETGSHCVSYIVRATGEQRQWECDAVAVCSGLHVLPNIPKIPGAEIVPVTMHSSEFTERKQFGVGKTVMVLGSGETGADVAYLAVTSPTKRVIMCHRSGFHFAPKRNLNPILFPALGGKPNGKLTVPLDNARASLFDTAYVHPRMRNGMALWVFYDLYVKSILWLNMGTSRGFHQHVGEPSPEKDHVSKLFFNKSAKASPFISAPYRAGRKTTLIDRLRSAIIQTPFPDTQGRCIDLAPWPERLDQNGTVHFTATGRPEYQRMKDQKIKPDIIVYCTGYTQKFPFLKQEETRPYPSAADANVRNIWRRDDPSVGFIGFVRPSLGAIPPLSEMQAQLWILNLLRPEFIPRPLLPSDEPHYRLHHHERSRVHYGVDHDSYVYQLGLDMDSAVGVIGILSLAWNVKRGWRLPLVWALCANFNTKFRLQGSWRWDGAADVLTSEMWTLLRRRRWFFDYFLLSFLPILIFGPMSLAFYIYNSLSSVLRAVGVCEDKDSMDGSESFGKI